MGSCNWMNLTVRRGVAGLVLLTALIYAHALGGAFLWDDEYFFLDNPRLLKETVRSAFTSDLFANLPNRVRLYHYRPLALLSYSWLARLFGVQPFGLHFASLAVHAAAGVLVFLLALEFTEIRVAWLTAALFVAHPLHVQAVAWMSAFSEVLAGALVFLSLYALVRARRGPKWLLAISYLAAALAFLTKETALALPLMAVLFVGWRAWPLFATAGGSLLLRYWAIGLASAPLPHRPLWRHLGLMEAAALQYAKNLVWPWPLAPEYALEHSPLAWLVFAAACALAVWLSYRHPQVRFALLLLVTGMAPALASSVVMPTLQLVRDRNAYVAVLGFALLIGYAARYRAGAWAALSLLVLWSALSVVAIGHWRDPETLWTHTLRVTPYSKAAVTELGFWYFSTQRFAEADRVYQHGLALRPNDPDLLASREAIRKAMNRSR